MAKDRTIFFPYCIKTQEIQQFVSLSLKILSKKIINGKGGGGSGNQETPLNPSLSALTNREVNANT